MFYSLNTFSRLLASKLNALLQEVFRNISGNLNFWFYSKYLKFVFHKKKYLWCNNHNA